MCVVASGGGGRGGVGARVNRSSFSITQWIEKICPYKSLQRSLTSNFFVADIETGGKPVNKYGKS
jgi:hypothetical protein